MRMRLSPLFNPQGLMNNLRAPLESRYSVSSGGAREGPWFHQPACSRLLSGIGGEEKHAWLSAANHKNKSSAAPLIDAEEVQQTA